MIVVGAVVKGKVGELEKDIDEVFIRRRVKKLTVLVGRVVDKKKYLVRFEYDFEKELSSIKLF